MCYNELNKLQRKVIKGKCIKAILKENALFFSSYQDVADIIHQIEELKDGQNFKNNNYLLIKDEYSWEKITSMYENLFESVLKKDMSQK